MSKIKLFPHQGKAVQHAIDMIEERGNALIVAGTGAGKCFGKGTPILMSDSSVKKVEDVVVGDKLMGVDGSPRVVLSLGRGKENLYLVKQTKGLDYVCNESHILSLRKTGTSKIENIEISQYLKRTEKYKHMMKGWKPNAMPFSNKNLKIDPYFLGVWLGDGSSRTVAISKPDKEIKNLCLEKAKKRKLYMRESKSGTCPTYHITSRVRSAYSNSLARDIRSYNLFCNKHIPADYKFSSIEDRLELLAGIIDTDGSLSHNGYEISQKSEVLANDIVFVARSLGFRVAHSKKKVNGEVYNRLYISGNTDIIPVKIPRKKAGKRKQKKNVLNTGIKVEPYGFGEYYGFEIDGDRLFLLADFTVVHNTIMLAATIGKFFNGFYARHKRRPHVLVLVHRTEIHGQNHTKFEWVCPGIATSEITAARKSLKGYVHFGMVQTVVGLMDEFARAGSFFDMIVVDEAHHAKATTYEAIINKNLEGNPYACLLGVTATPNRGDKLPLIELFDNYYQITTKFLIDGHYLVRPRFLDESPEFETDKGLEKGRLSKNCKPDISGRALISRLCKAYLEKKEPGKSVIFAPTHAFCEIIYDELKAMGRNPAYLSLGLDDMTRKAELERFESGNAEELINVDICTEGYDFPPLRNIIEFDTNGTHGQWIQKVGRVLRTAPGKTSCTVIDFGGNVELYPEGVETDVNLEGAMKKAKGEHLSDGDFFKTQKEREEALTKDYSMAEGEQHTPYNPPKGFETVLDGNVGIVFVACSESRDSVVFGAKDDYFVFTGDKTSFELSGTGSFHACMERAIEHIGNAPDPPERAISNLQIQLLAPNYPTSAMDWYGANCTICWKSWKEVLLCLSKNAKSKN